jgi:hypothetical protein
VWCWRERGVGSEEELRERAGFEDVGVRSKKSCCWLTSHVVVNSTICLIDRALDNGINDQSH